MIWRRPYLIALLVALPALAGCVSEPLHIAYRVKDGTSVTFDASKTIEGTLLVERNATLVLDHADILVEQALIVDGRIETHGGRIVFSGPYQRNDLVIDGVADLDRTAIHGAARVLVPGEATIRGGDVDARCLDASGLLDSEGVAWTFAQGSCETFAWDGRSYGQSSGIRLSGSSTIENGTLAFASSQTPHIRQDGGVARLGNLTVDAKSGGMILQSRSGDAQLWNVQLLARALEPSIRGDGGWIRLVDSPLPRNAQPPSVASSGRIDVLWTLTVRAVAALTQAPVANATVTLAGAQDPTAIEAQGVTDARGETRMIALEYRYDATPTQERTGNPHAIRVDGKAGSGASPAIVLEAPTTVTVPVLGAGAASSIAPPDVTLPRV